MNFDRTAYGFTWGAATIERCISDTKNGWVVLSIKTPRQDIQVYVTRTGKVRLYDYKTKQEFLRKKIK